MRSPTARRAAVMVLSATMAYGGVSAAAAGAVTAGPAAGTVTAATANPVRFPSASAAVAPDPRKKVKKYVKKCFKNKLGLLRCITEAVWVVVQNDGYGNPASGCANRPRTAGCGYR